MCREHESISRRPPGKCEWRDEKKILLPHQRITCRFQLRRSDTIIDNAYDSGRVPFSHPFPSPRMTTNPRMCNQMQSRLDALDRRVATTEAAVTIPEISHDPDHVSNLPSPRWRRDGAAGFTVGEAVEANGQVTASVERSPETPSKLPVSLCCVTSLNGLRVQA